MPVAPVIAKKLAAGSSAKAIGMELDRRAHTYVNDVDLSRSGENVNFHRKDEQPMPLDKAIERRMGELNTKRKIRSDAVKAVGFIVSSNNALPDKEAKAFLTDAVQWFSTRYGSKNMLAASIHMDEGTPHAHLWVCPVIHDKESGYDRLSAKELFTPDKRKKQPDGTWKVTAEGTMTKLQTDFWHDVASRYGYERPLSREQRGKGYRSLEAYKTGEGATRAAKARAAKAEKEAEKAKDGLEQTKAKVTDAQTTLDKLNDDIAAAREAQKKVEAKRLEAEAKARESQRLADAEAQRLESLRQVNRDLAPIADGLESAAADARGYEDAGRGGKREILDRIARACRRAADGLSRGAEGGGGIAAAIASDAGRARGAAVAIRDVLAARCDALVSRLRALRAMIPERPEIKPTPKRHIETWAERVARVKSATRHGMPKPGAGRGPQRPSASGPRPSRRR